MKTTTTTNSNTLQNVITATALLLMIVLGKGTLVSQNNSKSPYLVGISVGSQISGNAHGTIYEGSVGMYNGKNLFSAGACMSKRSMELCGAHFNYTRILTGKEDFSGNDSKYDVEPSKIQLFVYSRVQYLNNAPLSYNDVKKEETVMQNRDEVPSDASRIKLSTIDVSAGVGLNVKLCKQLVWGNYIGIGTYYHLNYKQGMYCENMAPVLVLGTSLRLNYFTR